MDKSQFSIIGGRMNYKNLTSKLAKLDERTFDILKAHIWMDMITNPSGLKSGSSHLVREMP